MNTLITIVGPTAVGKTALSIELAKTFESVIISADSRQFYQHMDIGTAKPTKEELAAAKHYFIDSLKPDEEFSAAKFETAAEDLMNRLFPQHPTLIMVGGSTLYMDAIWNGFSPMPFIDPSVRETLNQEFRDQGLDALLKELAEVDPDVYGQIDKQNPARVIRALEVYRGTGTPISVFRQGRNQKKHAYRLIKIGLQDEREVLYNRIDQRVHQMIAEGLVEEAKDLLGKGYAEHLNALQAIGYRELFPYLKGEYDLDEAIRLIQRNSRRYAKRQLTYYRRFEDISWFQAGQNEEVLTWLKKELED
ncbi:MAG: tRNA (adenosine(37)-N6)-dimethylallyltransferase MiaA [Bacteroidota bacterium]